MTMDDGPGRNGWVGRDVVTNADGGGHAERVVALAAGLVAIPAVVGEAAAGRITPAN